MPTSPAAYNLVAIGDGGVWMKLGCEISKIDKCRLIRIPNSLSPYSICDKYKFRAIILLPDAIEIYQGSCHTWVQRLRFGPNVNTPIVAILQDSATRNNDEEMKQLMQLNVINWILTSQELQAVRIVRVLYHCEMGIRRCLQSSARMIVRYGTRRKNTATSETERSYPMLDQSGEEPLREVIRRNVRKRRHPCETEHVLKRQRLGAADTTVEHQPSLSTSAPSSPQSTSEPLEYYESTLNSTSSKSTLGQRPSMSSSDPVPPKSTLSSSSLSNAPHTEVTSAPTVAHAQRCPGNKVVSNRQHSLTNRRAFTAPAQSENAGLNHKNTPLSERSKRDSLQRRTNELNNKLHKAMMYILRVRKLLEGETRGSRGQM